MARSFAGVEYAQTAPQLLVAASEVFFRLFFHRSLELLHEFLAGLPPQARYPAYFLLFRIFYNSLERVFHLPLVHRRSSPAPSYTSARATVESHASVHCPSCASGIPASFVRFRIVSIMPNVGGNLDSPTSPNLERISVSTWAMAPFLRSSLGNDFILPFRNIHANFCRYCKPGGTGTPIRFISARLTFTKRFLISAFPSAW